MALTFGGATSDDVNHGTDASLTALDPFTVIQWVFPTTLTTNRRLWGKQGSGVGGGFALDGTGGNVRLEINRDTVDALYITSDTPLSTNTWKFVASCFSSADAEAHIYTGNLTALAVESTYGTATIGSGAVPDDSANDFAGGNANGAASVAFQGRIAFIGVWNRKLTLAEVHAQQFRPHVTAGCVLFCHYGYNGTSTQPDYSGNGNNGTVTGATVADHVPLMAFRRSGPLYVPYTVAAGGGLSIPVVYHHRQRNFAA